MTYYIAKILFTMFYFLASIPQMQKKDSSVRVCIPYSCISVICINLLEFPSVIVVAVAVAVVMKMKIYIM
jgi:hypothetical protein